MRKPQVIPDEDHEVVYERVAAVDVAKASGVVCMRTPDPARPGRYVNQIWDNVPATRARITELGLELIRCQVQMVTLESTSDYWRIWLRREAPCCIPGLAGRNLEDIPGSLDFRSFGAWDGLGDRSHIHSAQAPAVEPVCALTQVPCGHHAGAGQ